MKVSKDENLTEFLLEVKEKMAQIVNSNDPDISSINTYIFKHPGKLIRSKILVDFQTKQCENGKDKVAVLMKTCPSVM